MYALYMIKITVPFPTTEFEICVDNHTYSLTPIVHTYTHKSYTSTICINSKNMVILGRNLPKN